MTSVASFLVVLRSVLLPVNPLLAFSLKNCTILYKENVSADVSVDCRNMNFVAVPDYIPKNTVSIQLGHNQLLNINKKDFYGMSKLKNLNLKVNQIAYIEQGSFINLVLLERLDMENNKLTSLTANMFEGLSNLTVLDLSKNKIQHIHESAFQCLTSLQTLKIFSIPLNKVAEILPVFHLPQLLRLNIKYIRFTTFDTKDLPLNHSLSLEVLKISSFNLKILSIIGPISPHLQTIGLLLTDIKSVLFDKSLLKNITSLDVSTGLVSFEGINEILGSLERLRDLTFESVEGWIANGLLSTVCKIQTLRKLTISQSHFHNFTTDLASCTQLSELNLEDTFMQKLSKGSVQSIKQLRFLNLGYNVLTKIPHDIRSLSALEILIMCRNDISDLKCNDFSNTIHLKELYLNGNHISKLERCVTENLVNLKVLDMSNNELNRFGDSFKISLQKLEALDISRNSIQYLDKDVFQHMKALKELKVETYHIVDVPYFSGLENIENLTIYLHTDRTFQSFQSNNNKPFSDIKTMKQLTLIGRGNTQWVPLHTISEMLKAYGNLETVTVLNIYINYYEVETFELNLQLKSLTLSLTDLSYISSKFFLPLPNLQSLDLSKSKLRSLNFLVQANLSALRYLNLTHNEIDVISETVFQSLPSLRFLDLDNNPFLCECSNAGFIHWVVTNPQTQVVNAHQYKCFFPADKQEGLLLEFDVQSCRNNGSFLYFISSSCLVVLTLLTSFVYKFLRWHLTYTFHLFRAFLYDSRKGRKKDPHQFDAFVSYNVHDEDWVYREMLPVLEGQQGWRLCLHHRDFQPGKPIIENITDAIYGSRKTICVISRSYLQSEWCSREIQMASFRLFDEKKDVLILLFLENIPPHHLSPYYRMRKLVQKRTYLSWPQAAQHPGVFWQNVQRALQAGGALTENTHLLTGPTKEPPVPVQNNATQTSNVIILERHCQPPQSKEMAAARHPSSCFILQILLLVVYFNFSFPYVLKECIIRYQENPSADIAVDCANRKIENIPKDIPKDAVSLNLNNNWMQKINEGDFSAMSKLRTLDLTSNQIAHVDQGSFIGLMFLQTLCMGNNKLDVLTNNMFQGLDKLTVLFLNNNGIQVIHTRAFQFLTSLQTLDLGNNRLQQITDIQPVLQLPQITTLGLKCNGFSSFETKDLELNQPSNLKELDISGDSLIIFSISTPVFPFLQKIEISMCFCYKDLQWEIPDKQLLRNISYLYLGRSILSFEGITKVLESLDSLSHLRLEALKMHLYEGLLSTICKVPTLRKLDLFNSHINNLPIKLELCSQLTELNIRKSDVGELPQGSLGSLKHLQSLNICDNQLKKVPHDARNLSSLEILNLNYNYISEMTCEDFENTTQLTELHLKRNRISQVDDCVFLNLENLKLLDLSFNRLLTFENNIVLPKVEILNINHNEIAFLKTLDFLGFQSLKQLDVGTAFFDDMTQRSFHKVNKLENIISSRDEIWELKLLENLTIELNPESLFSSLQTNYSRDIVIFRSMKRYTAICKRFCFPYQLANILWSMRYLENFTAVNIFFEAPPAGMFLSNPYLKSVTFTETDFSVVDPELFLPIPNLQSLELSKCNISSLGFLVKANLSALRYLKLTDNELDMINDTVFKSFPSLTYLDLDNNPFTCNCSNAGFIQWVKDNKQTQVVNAHQYKCSSPVDKRESLLLEFDVHSCWDDGRYFYFISSSCLVVLTLLTSFIYNFLWWHLTYTFHLFLAYFYDSQRKKKEVLHRFDAFVSYNVHDEDWVYREMLPVLEGQQGWRLCLHHRDFQPGKPIIENITDAIYGSRKTICVISRSYLQSEWCSREIQMASFRLFDEKKDVLVLLFLENIPSRHLSPYYRLRKLVKKRTYLSWPQAAEHPAVFWQNVQRALQAGGALAENTDPLP
ncbi:uncharacterized protein LOC129353274 [Poeciliopsis prolifica]|uniref:uncharacterized protein LOC129353274 n=1 Tax=Poeciliopsis prolifica TaxID=188132 RepID=UPI0024144563|nr:uncharacterized protein LOC129353274 [Poeciliopsis prolifica]